MAGLDGTGLMLKQVLSTFVGEKRVHEAFAEIEKLFVTVEQFRIALATIHTHQLNEKKDAEARHLELLEALASPARAKEILAIANDRQASKPN